MGPLKSRKLRKNAILGGVYLGKNSHRASSDLPNLIVSAHRFGQSESLNFTPDIRRILEHNDTQTGLVRHLRMR